MKTFLLVYVLSGQVVDVGSTAVIFKRGCHEGNPVNRALRLTTIPRLSIAKGSVSALYVWQFGKMHKKHPKLTTTSALIAGSAGWAAATYNLTALRCR